MTKRKTAQEFVQRAQEVHGDRFDYSKVDYQNNKIGVTIVCPDHGSFEQTPNNHLKGGGCSHCSGHGRLSQSDFLCRAVDVHGDRYNYDNCVFLATAKKVIVTCKRHGDFVVEAAAHLRGNGCKKCVSENLLLTMPQWLARANKRHGERYSYDKVDYKTANAVVTIGCKIHGDFKQRSHQHLQGGGCPRCAQHVSRGCMEWLEAMTKIDNTHIQHGGNGGEVRVTGTLWHADGYSAELHKVYEFHGEQLFGYC